MSKIENPMKVKPIFPLLIFMSVPTMISMLIQSMYNIVDSIFISNISVFFPERVLMMFNAQDNIMNMRAIALRKIKLFSFHIKIRLK